MRNHPKENVPAVRDKFPFAHVYCRNMGSIISVELKISEVRAVSDEFRFETFVDAHSSIFHEYLSSVISKLPESNEDYRAIQESDGSDI